MADLHRPYGGDFFRPSSAHDSATLPYHGSVFGSATKNPFPREIYTTAPPPPQPPRQQFALALPAPSTAPPAATRRGGRWRAVSVGCFSDPEMKRRRRVAGYKAYAVEGKVKASLRRGLRWFKHKCSGIFRV